MKYAGKSSCFSSTKTLHNPRLAQYIWQLSLPLASPQHYISSNNSPHSPLCHLISTINHINTVWSNQQSISVPVLLSEPPFHLLYLNTNTYISQTRANKRQIKPVFTQWTQAVLLAGFQRCVALQGWVMHVTWCRSNTLAQLQLTSTFLLSGKPASTLCLIFLLHVQLNRARNGFSWFQMRFFFSNFESNCKKMMCFLLVGCYFPGAVWWWRLCFLA